jgi:hypothetical protein
VPSPTFSFSTIGSYNVNLLQPAQGAHSTGVSPSFSWDNYSGATNYIFQLSADNFNSILSEHTVNVNSIQLPFLLEKNKFYSWKVGAVKGQNITWSETRTFFTGDPFQSVNLTQPINHAVNQPLSVNFKWLKSFTNVNYKFQLAVTNDFSSIEFESYLSDTILSVNNLNPSQQYFWRVVQDRVFNGNSFSVNSPVHSFSTTTITDTEDPLSRNVLTAYPNPFDKEIFFKFYNLNPGVVSFAVVNSLGRPVAQFSKSIEYSRETIISWDGTNDQKQTLPVGVYIIHINAGTFTRQLKVVLTK